MIQVTRYNGPFCVLIHYRTQLGWCNQAQYALSLIGARLTALPRSLSDDAAKGLHGAARRAPVGGLAVVALLQEVLAPAVVGVLVEDPDALCHLAGVHVPHAEALQHRGAVLRGLVRLPRELGLVVQLDLVQRSPAGLWDEWRERGKGREERVGKEWRRCRRKVG